MFSRFLKSLLASKTKQNRTKKTENGNETFRHKNDKISGCKKDVDTFAPTYNNEF